MNYFDVYKDIWDFHKNFQMVKTTDEYWESVVNESDRIAKKYNECKFVRALLLAVIEELERIHKEIIKDADTTI